MKIKLAFISLNAKMILKIIPDRLVAGRKILALLTVVRIHLRENKEPDTFVSGSLLFREDTNHTGRQGGMWFERVASRG